MRALALVAMLAGCDLSRMQSRPGCALDTTLDGEPCNRPAPPGIVAYHDIEQPPPPVTRELLARGRDRYDRFCAACHAVDGTGETEVSMWAQQPITSLLTPAYAQLTDAQIIAAIQHGARTMPRQPLAHRDRWAVLHYVRVLQNREEVR